MAESDNGLQTTCDVAFNWFETDTGVNIDSTNSYSYGNCQIDHGHAVFWMMANGDNAEFDFVDQFF